MHALGVAGLAVVLLAVTATVLDPSRLHLNGFNRTLNDQVGYVSVARNLVESGELRSNLVYPSILGQGETRSILYMPGHYLCLAASFAVLGVGVLGSLAPSLVAFVVAALATWALSYRLLGLRGAWAAACLFLAFPANHVFAFTAMAEMTFVAAGALALLAVHLVREERRAFAAPLVVVAPFLFRESAALLLVPISIWVLCGEGSRRARFGRIGALVALSSISLTLVYSIDVSSGRGSLFAANLFEPTLGATYADAFAEVDASWSRLPEALADKVEANLGQLLSDGERAPASLQVASVAAFLASALAGLILALARKEARAVALGASGLILATFLAITCLYTIGHHRGLRMLLFAWPAACALWAQVGLLLFGGRRAGPILGSVACALLLGAGLLAVRRQREPMTAFDARDDEDLAFVRSLAHDDGTLLIAPWNLALPYVHTHHPVAWSFVPANDATLELLAEHHDIGTMLVPLDSRARPANGGAPSPGAARRAGLEPHGTVAHRGRRYALYR